MFFATLLMKFVPSGFKRAKFLAEILFMSHQQTSRSNWYGRDHLKEFRTGIIAWRMEHSVHKKGTYCEAKIFLKCEAGRLQTALLSDAPDQPGLIAHPPSLLLLFFGALILKHWSNGNPDKERSERDGQSRRGI